MSEDPYLSASLRDTGLAKSPVCVQVQFHKLEQINCSCTDRGGCTSGGCATIFTSLQSGQKHRSSRLIH